MSTEIDLFKTSVVLLLDPLPIVEDSVSGPQHRLDPQDELDRFVQNQHMRDPNKLEVIKVTMESCLFGILVPRAPLIDYESIMSNDTRELTEHLTATKSTATDLLQWLRPQKYLEINANSRSGRPLDFLFKIICCDTLEVLHLIDLALTEIDHNIHDESLTQQRLPYWRHLMEQFEYELRHLPDALPRIAGFIDCLGLPKD